MNSAEQILLDRSHTYLRLPSYAIEASLTGQPERGMVPRDALKFGKFQFDAIANLLKSTVDLNDLDTFIEVEREWTRLFDDVWLPGFPDGVGESGWSDKTGKPPGPELVQLLRRREILRFGLAMWVAHLLRSPLEQSREENLSRALQVLAAHYESVEHVLDAYEAASDLDNEDRTPFTDWFLGELPTGEAHFIPTLHELLFTALLLSARMVQPETPAALRPREWFTYRQEDCARQLEALSEQGERWQRLLGLPAQPAADLGTPSRADAAWQVRLERLQWLIEEGERAQREAEQARIRSLPLDQERVTLVRRETLRQVAGSRLFHDIFARLDAVQGCATPPNDPPPLVSRTWAPKSFFTATSRVVGLEMMARELARGTAQAERQQVQAALPEGSPQQPEDDLPGAVSEVIRQMRDEGMRPSLLLLPANWRLERELGFDSFRSAAPSHPLIPPAQQSAFSGVFDDVPAMRFAGLPQEQLWIIDVPRAMRFVEWPSDEGTGIRFQLESFDEGAARQLLTEHPEVRGADRTEEAAIQDVQEKVLISISLCWRIEPADASAAVAVAVPAALRRED